MELLRSGASLWAAARQPAVIESDERVNEEKKREQADGADWIGGWAVQTGAGHECV